MSNQTSINFTQRPNRCIDPKFDVYFGIQICILIPTDILAIITNLSFLRALHFCSTLQPNVRLMLKNISVGLLLQCFNDLVQFIYNVVLFRDGYQDVIRSPSMCVLLQSPTTLAVSCIIFSFLFIGIERLFFTLKSTDDTKIQNELDKSGIVTKVTLVLVWFTGLPILISPIFNSRNLRVCYCSLSYVTRDVELYVITAIYIMVQLAAIVLYATVCYMNKRELTKFSLHTVTHSLSDRSKAWRNVRTTLMLFPSAVLQGICFTVALTLKISTQSTVFNINLKDGLDIRLAMLWTQVFIIFCAIHPILCIRNHHLLAKTAKEKSIFLMYFVGSRKIDIVGQTENFSVNPDTHQNQLLNFWENTRGEKMQNKKRPVQ